MGTPRADVPLTAEHEGPGVSPFFRRREIDYSPNPHHDPKGDLDACSKRSPRNHKIRAKGKMGTPRADGPLAAEHEGPGVPPFFAGGRLTTLPLTRTTTLKTISTRAASAVLVTTKSERRKKWGHPGLTYPWLLTTKAQECPIFSAREIDYSPNPHNDPKDDL